MKLKVQAQHLQPGDVVGSGDCVDTITINSIKWPSSKVYIELKKVNGDIRGVFWGKYTEINIERPEKVSTNG